MTTPEIPPEKQAAVANALREAFGVTDFEDIRPMTGGHTTSLVLRIVVRGNPYLLKIILRTDDPTRHYQSMRAAAAAGIAPKVWYTSVEDRTSITDSVDTVALPATTALTGMPALLRTLHALPRFPRIPDAFNTSCMFLMNEGPGLDAFVQRICAANILPKEEIDRFFAWRAQISAIYPRNDPDMVSSHNDLFKPDNVLCDGNRLWLIDWECAFLNDRYADLAVVANYAVTNEDEAKIYLAAYFGQPPDEYQRARFFLMPQIAHMFYAIVFQWLGAEGKPVDRTEPAPDFTGFYRGMHAGEVNLANNSAKVMFGGVHWERLIENMRQTRFDDAMRLVRDRHA